MHTTAPRRHLALAATLAALVGPLGLGAAQAANTAGTATTANTATTQAAGSTAAPADRAAYSDRVQMKAWNSEKERLQAELKLGEAKAFYPKALADRGYVLTAVNAESNDSVEYEVVKGRQSYEVQIDFDRNGRASKVDVSTNAWRADATKAALAGKTVPVASRYEKGNEAYSDRANMKTWSGEKDRLEKLLATGRDRAAIEQALKQQGYQITSVNDAERDHVEYEVVKGRDSFEVQVNFDNGKSSKVDVTTNVWQSDATERALSAARR